jgi:hypothetical protein
VAYRSGVVERTTTKKVNHNVIFGGTEMSKATGVSKWFSRLQNYGYINPDDGDQDADGRDPKTKGGNHKKSPTGNRTKSELAKQGKDSQA